MRTEFELSSFCELGQLEGAEVVSLGLMWRSQGA